MTSTLILAATILLLIVTIAYGIRKNNKKLILVSAISLLILAAFIGNLMYAVKFSM